MAGVPPDQELSRTPQGAPEHSVLIAPVALSQQQIVLRLTPLPLNGFQRRRTAMSDRGWRRSPLRWRQLGPVVGSACLVEWPTWGISQGGMAYIYRDEFHTKLRFCQRGLITMTNAGKDDNGSKFFFILSSTPDLQNKHTIFGKVTGGAIYNMLKLEEALVDEENNVRTLYPPKIRETEILNNPFSDIIPRIIVQESEEVKDSLKIKTATVKYCLFSCIWKLMQKAEKRINDFTSQQGVKEVKGKACHNESVAFEAPEKRCFKCNSTSHLAHTC
ncbi:Peptidyl-prolyl cis-trans isomerase CWC27 like protein [Eufriesea mexicana]|uniref:Peptidyl-prolyl cis-trans isomerase n=1 Tax=Eufriesea mexicana TaxID=516756 RepID=A0A310SV16_9HYME|nr:Peptidyl-prolyl cis-trans isomerase CWC27 like protein [Eufriesea mexicana]